MKMSRASLGPLALALAVPTLVGCPGRLDQLAWLDGGVTYGPPPDGGAAAPPPPPVQPGVDARMGTPSTPTTPEVPPTSPPSMDAAPPVQVPLCATAAEITSKIFMPKCGGCHSGAMPRAGLDLVMPGAKARLLNIPAKNAACVGRPLIVDAPAVGGVFFDKISGMTCGNQMPFMGMALSAAEIQCLKDWIKPSPPVQPPAFDPACATAAEIQNKIFTPKCAACHGGAMPRAGLDLATAGSKARMLAATAKNAACAGRPLLTADATGVFFDKLGGMGCGNQMPFMGTPLNATEIQCLKEWVKPTMAPPPPPPDAGAPPNMAPLCAQPAEISSKILVPVCGACHGAINPAAGLDLASAGAKARLLNVASKGCAGKPLIVADPVPAGVFFDKLAGPIPGCGNQMPFGAPPLGLIEIKCLKDWIKPLP